MGHRPNDLPGGQNFTGGYYLMQDNYQTSDNGIVAIQNGKTAFSPVANSAYRGLLFTNDRKTVVIQDQISLSSAETVCWVAHTKVLINNIKISSDKRTAYMMQRVGDDVFYLRVAIVSADTSLKFSIMDAGINDFLLEKTHRPGWSEEHGGEKEDVRTAYRRLVIKSEATMSFNCAVVIERVDGFNSTDPVGYTWEDMFSWDADKVYAEKPDIDIEDTESENDSIKMSTISSAGKKAMQMIESNYAFTSRMPDFFKTLCNVFETLEVYPPESFENRVVIKDGYLKYLSAKAYWDSYIGFVNYHASMGHSLIMRMAITAK